MINRTLRRGSEAIKLQDRGCFVKIVALLSIFPMSKELSIGKPIFAKMSSQSLQEDALQDQVTDKTTRINTDLAAPNNNPSTAMLFLLLVSRQGKCRLAKWFSSSWSTASLSSKAYLIQRTVLPSVMQRRSKQCHFVDVVHYEESGRHHKMRLIYKKYASLWFISAVDLNDQHPPNSLIVLDIIHRYVELLDRYFGNVCELDIIFNYQKAFYALDELCTGGLVVESSWKVCLRNVLDYDEVQKEKLFKKENKK